MKKNSLSLMVLNVSFLLVACKAHVPVSQTFPQGLSQKEAPALDKPVHISQTLSRGVYTIQQMSSGRYVDAHEISSQDYGLVTRPAHNIDSQRWIVTPFGNNTYTIQQMSNNRYVDAHEVSSQDYGIVTRPAQNNDSQKWMVTPLGNNTYTIQQKSSGRYMDAYQASNQDYRLVTRPAQNNDSQKWILIPKNTYTIQQKSSYRYMDAYQSSSQDYRLVTRPAQNNDSQKWILKPLGNNIYTIQQKSNGRYVDAHEVSSQDYGLVTRHVQNNDSQRWVVTPLGNNTYTIQQKSNGRYVDAYQASNQDYHLVTRSAQNNDTQRWLIKVSGQVPHQNYQYNYKGQVHCHSSKSGDADILNTPSVLETAYKNTGYDFVCLTDHNQATPDPQVPGILHILSGEDGYRHPRHILALGINLDKVDPSIDTDGDGLHDGSTKYAKYSQPRIDYLAKQGALAFLAHPSSDDDSWQLPEVLTLSNYTGISIYNAGQKSAANQKNINGFWDPLLKGKRNVWGVATDDWHGQKHLYNLGIATAIHSQKENFNRGWILVNSDRWPIEQGDILQNIRDGNFFAYRRTRTWFSTQQKDGYDLGEKSQARWPLNLTRDGGSSFLSRIILIHKTSTLDHADTDGDFRLWIQNKVLSVPKNKVLSVINSPYDREKGRTDFYELNIRNHRINFTDLSAGDVELEIYGNEGDDGWLPESVFVLGETVGGKCILLAGTADWPSDSWFDKETDEGQPRREIPLQSQRPLSGLLKNLYLIHKTSRSKDANTDGKFKLWIQNKELSIPDNPHDREWGRTDFYRLNVESFQVTYADLDPNDVSLEIYGSDSDDAWLPESVVLIAETVEGEYFVLAANQSWPSTPPTIRIETIKAGESIAVTAETFDGPTVTIVIKGGSGSLLRDHRFKSPGQTYTYRFVVDDIYIRIQAEDIYGSVTYSQPFFIDPQTEEDEMEVVQNEIKRTIDLVE